MPSNHREVYKVVRPLRSGGVCSAVTPDPNRIEYPVGTWVTVEGQKLFCFDTLESAKAFLPTWQRLAHAQIWLCLACGVGVPRKMASHVSEQFLKSFWKLRRQKKRVGGVPPPKGSLWADSLMLKERVPWTP